MTYIVALTGGIGSGKTTVSNGFKKIGVDVIDTDIIAKNIIQDDLTTLNIIKKKFGKKILNINNSINRSMLRKIIFSNKADRIWLENLLHPKILKETKNQIKLMQSSWCLWVVPLLIEKKLEKQPNRVLLIDTPINIQIRRIIKRDKISPKEAKSIILIQTSRRKRISMSDDIIVNDKNIQTLNTYVYYFNIFYKYLAKKYNQKENVKCFKKNYITKFY